MERFISFFQIDAIEITIVLIMFSVFLIQIFFYSYYYIRPLSYQSKRQRERSNTVLTPSVSVIITVKEESEILEHTLPVILTQDYPNYEVIVVNNGFTEETDTLLNRLQQEHSHLYHTFLPEHSDKESIRKRLALTIGIKAAQNDILLFTEADTMPSGNRWIASMMENMTSDKDIVLGYCYFEKAKKFFTRIARFDNLLFSMQYLSMAILGKPFTGIYRNIAYRKNLFFDNKGFADFLNYEHGEANFLNGIMTTDNTNVALSEDSFVSTRIGSYSHWASIKLFYYKTQRHSKKFRFSFKKFSLEIFTRYLLYLLLIIATGYSLINGNYISLIVCGFLYLLQLVLKISLLNRSTSYFKAGKFHFSFALLELLQPLYNMRFKSLSSKKNRYFR